MLLSLAWFSCDDVDLWSVGDEIVEEVHNVCESEYNALPQCQVPLKVVFAYAIEVQICEVLLECEERPSPQAGIHYLQAELFYQRAELSDGEMLRVSCVLI